jgi:hypothetical protein
MVARFELGMLVGLQKRVLGYSHEVEDLHTRVEGFRTKVELSPREISVTMSTKKSENADELMDDSRFAFELMIGSWLAYQGHPILHTKVSGDQLFQSLSGFEACLRQARTEEDKP